MTHCGLWTKRLYTIRARSIPETMETINDLHDAELRYSVTEKEGLAVILL